VGWEVRPSFSVSQNGDRAEVLHVIQGYFGCGSIRPDRSDRTLKWETRRLDDLVARVIPHFKRYPLLSERGLTSNGSRPFANWQRRELIAAEPAWPRSSSSLGIMNPSGKRRYDAEAILASLRQGEGIVCASGNGGETRSSDLHEWRNDLGAVSSRDPVKL
jgi:LAGLIDADG endonuclease